MKKIILIAFILSTRLTFGQIVNGDFEIWDTTYTGNYSSYLSSLFAVPNPKAGVLNHWVAGSPFGVSQTTDSYSGNYALILHNWYNYATEWITYHQPLTNRPKYLQGYFKYITGGVNGLSHGLANVTLTRFNGTSNDTIANGKFEFDSTVSYTPFQITLNYVSSLNPDSITIYIINSKVIVSGNVVCHLLYLDNLALTNSASGIGNVNSNENRISVFPNPSSGKFTFQTDRDITVLNIYDVSGKLVYSQKNISAMNNIDISAYADGVFFYELTNNAGQVIRGKIFKQKQ